MKSRIIHVIVLNIITNIIFAQSGIIKYKVFLEKQTEVGKADVKEILNKMIVNANKQEFELKFSGNISNFDIVTKINELNYEDKFAFNAARAGLTSFSQVIFDNKNKDIYEINNDGVITKENLGENYWQITNEKKIIDNYTCIKAFHIINFLTRNGSKTSRVITAWFAPNLPYNFGPKNYNGLPGLILELLDKKTTFLATSIKLSKVKIDIKLPNGKTISKEDYDKKLKSQMGM